MDELRTGVNRLTIRKVIRLVLHLSLLQFKLLLLGLGAVNPALCDGLGSQCLEEGRGTVQ